MHQTAESVRLIPPSEATGTAWLAEDYLGRHRYRIPVPASMILIALIEPGVRDNVERRIASLCAIDIGRMRDLVDNLIDLDLVVDAGQVAQDTRLDWFTRLRREWGRWHWSEAAEYHLLTYDMKFFDYGVDGDGRKQDTEMMLRYTSESPDVDRYKRYSSDLDYKFSNPSTTLIDTPLEQAITYGGPDTKLCRHQLDPILSVSLGQIGEIHPRRYPAEPLLRRTSPSGGARHPTEGYVLVLDVDEIDPGWYHISTSPPGLETLSTPVPDRRTREQIFPLAYLRVPMVVQAIVVLTSIFSRNMYRYREARTFRTIHMDAGHIAETLKICATAMGIGCHVVYGDDDSRIESCLGLDPFREGYLMSVALGHHT